jgi:hypothetical protein
MALRVVTFPMPNPKKKQPCVCAHSKSIHHTMSIKGKIQSPCNFPGCSCKDYRASKS